jgi:hypothetical protein
VIENFKISDEEFKSKFSEWLFEQSLSDFKTINGFEIVSSFFKQYLLNDLLKSRADYKYFISDKRELIKIIENWIETLELSFDDYKFLFEIYCKDFMKENSNILKISFTSIHKSFQNEIIQPNYFVAKTIIVWEDLKYIFKNSVDNYKLLQLKDKNERIIANREAKLVIKRNERLAIREAKLIAKRNERLVNASVKKEETILKAQEYKRQYRKKYKERFPEKVKAEKKIYKTNRIHKDPAFKILQRMRARILLVLHGKRKFASSLQLLGCSPDFLKFYLESRFKEGMTWDNYGVKGWHIDHIIPCASFDFTKTEDQKKCFHYSNLQPLWWFDNLMKSDKFLE